MGKTSSVWSHAKRMDSNTTKCNLCEEIVSAKGGNTSTIKRHLIALHKVDFDKPISEPQSSITNFLIPAKSKLNKAWINQIDCQIASFVACDGRPISTVEGNGFRELIKFLEPEYIVKSRATTTALIKEIYAKGAAQMNPPLLLL